MYQFIIFTRTLWSLAVIIPTFRRGNREIKKGTEGLSYLPKVTQEGVDQNLDWSSLCDKVYSWLFMHSIYWAVSYYTLQRLTRETTLLGLSGILVQGIGYKDDGRDEKLNRDGNENQRLATAESIYSPRTGGGGALDRRGGINRAQVWDYQWGAEAMEPMLEHRRQRKQGNTAASPLVLPSYPPWMPPIGWTFLKAKECERCSSQPYGAEQGKERMKIQPSGSLHLSVCVHGGD